MKLTLLLFLHSCWMKAQELLAFDPRGSYFALIFSWHQKHILLRQQALQQLFPHNLYVAHFSHLHSVVNCAKVHCRLVQLVYAGCIVHTPASQPRRFFARLSHLCKCSSFLAPLGNSIGFSFATRHQIYLSFLRRAQERIFYRCLSSKCRSGRLPGQILSPHQRRDSTPVARAIFFFL